MKLTVVGLGLIGGSLARDLKALGFCAAAAGVDASPEHARRALALGLVDEVRSLEAAVPEADVVALCVPVDAIEEMLPKVLDLAGPAAAVTDMGSTKRRICEAVARHPRRARYVASHPMAGTEHSGPDAALRGLFLGKTTVICERDRSAEDAVARIEAMYRALGMRMIFMDADEHDLHTAYISHLSHITSFVLANTVLDKEQDVATIFDLASAGFESTARLGKSSPEMWEPIFRKNKDAVLRTIRSYERHLSDFRDSIADGDKRRLSRLMRNANGIRPVLARIGAAGEKAAGGDSLEALRAEIDRLDETLLQTLSARLSVVRRIGRLKRREGAAPHQPTRWQEILETRLMRAKALGLAERFVQAVLETIHAEAIRLQEADASRTETPSEDQR